MSISANVSSVFRSTLFFKPLSLWSRIFLPRNFSDHRSRLLLVVSVVLSCLGSSLLFSSLVWYVFLLLPLFTFSCSGFHGFPMVIVCLLFLTFFCWNSVEHILVVGSYCSDFRVIKACLDGILPLYHSFDLPYTFPIMRTSSGPNCSSGLRIGGSFTEEHDLGQTCEGSSHPAIVVDRVPLAGPPSSFGKGKSKVNEIRYLGSSDYLRAAMQNVEAVGPIRIEPFFGKTFAACYKPPFGVHVWCPNFLTSYIIQVPKMVCFFEAAFENGLHFPLHPFIKSVLQHFNVCPSQLSPNIWGVLVELLVVFRDKGLGVPSIALLLYFFSVKEAKEGFLYISKRTKAKLIISDLLSSHKHWKERYFFISGVIRSIILLIENIRLAFQPFGLPLRTYVRCF